MSRIHVSVFLDNIRTNTLSETQLTDFSKRLEPLFSTFDSDLRYVPRIKEEGGSYWLEVRDADVRDTNRIPLDCMLEFTRHQLFNTRIGIASWPVVIDMRFQLVFDAGLAYEESVCEDWGLDCVD
jgi:hypothetical protein